MTILQFHEYAQSVLAPTEPMFRLVPENATDWKPTETSFTTGQLLHHIAYSLKFNSDGIQKNIWAVQSMRHVFLANRKTPNSSVEDAVRYYRETSTEFLNVFSVMSDDEFQNGEVDSVQLGREKKWRVALFALEHHLNHKAELFMYLKMMGIKVTTKELYLG